MIDSVRANGKFFRKSSLMNKSSITSREDLSKTGFKTKNYFNLSSIRNFRIKPKIEERQINLKYEENYENNIDSLRKSLTTLKSIKEKEMALKEREKNFVNKSLGMKYFEIPNIVTNKEMSPKFKLVNQKLEKVMEQSKDPYVENEKLNEYMSNFNRFQSSNKFPDIKVLNKQQKIKNVNTKIQTFFMGEQYNPMNYYHSISRSMVRRNLHGALFQH